MAFIISPTPPPLVFGGVPATGGLGVTPPGDAAGSAAGAAAGSSGAAAPPLAGATYGRSVPPAAAGVPGTAGAAGAGAPVFGSHFALASA